MKVDGVSWRAIRTEDGGRRVRVIDQTRLPHRLETVELETAEDAARAIGNMTVRGAPLIGATAAYGLALAMRSDPSDAGLDRARESLLTTRPTAVNLRRALDAMSAELGPLPEAGREAAAFRKAAAICDEDAAICEAIGEHGLELIRAVHGRRGGTVGILTHCNAGRLATVDWGTALAPVYKAFDAGIPLHVWVSETRPRNQGAALTAWELGRHGVSHTVVVDGAGGHLMQTGRVDMVIVGADRVSANGDVCNKIGTYPKALAAVDNGVPFHVALPSPTIDWTLASGAGVPIEERPGDEVSTACGRGADGGTARVRIAPEGSPAANPAFDVTPARLVTGFVTERGAVAPSGLARLFPERSRAA